MRSLSTLSDADNGGAEEADLVTETTSTYERSPLRENRLHIFFIETSGRLCLTARQACGVESAARANPNASITLYMEKTEITTESVSDRRQDCVITNTLFQQMRNIKVAREELLGHLKDTPLWKLYQTGSLNMSKCPLVHRSDAVRVALLWKKGGIYLDLDAIVFRPLESLNNTVGKVKDFVDNWVENGVMAFQAGHPFLKYFMKTMIESFRPEDYLSLGPGTLYPALLEFCDRDDLPSDRWLICWRNSSLFVQPPEAFYAVSNLQRKRFYQQEADQDDWDQLRASYLSHIYGSSNVGTVPIDSLYAILAQKYCPISYGIATKERNDF